MSDTVKFAAQKYQQIKVADVQPHPENPRLGNLAAIGSSIEANGFYGAIVVQKSTGHILAGNHRYLAARQLGVETIPAIVVDVDDVTARCILLADNRTSDLGSYDDASPQLDSGFQYQIIIDCDDESSQRSTLAELTERGLKCRLMIL